MTRLGWIVLIFMLILLFTPVVIAFCVKPVVGVVVLLFLVLWIRFLLMLVGNENYN